MKEKRESLTYRKFLKSGELEPTFEFYCSMKHSFIYYLNRYKSSTLRPENVKRLKTHKFSVVEEKFVCYIQLQCHMYQRDKCGLSWLVLKQWCMEWKNMDPDMRNESFSCLADWLNKDLKRRALTKIKLQSGANSMTREK
mmetsp:Transcript_16093/g.36205  ORF Transcript_16093/g.36205 Transcript_16093/m.36205 type:complete len:140 (+) Transcript_16093:244-663(+)